MAYDKTTWVDNSFPSIDEINLNNIEDGIADHDIVVSKVDKFPIGDIWNWMYYADEDDTNPRVLGMNAETMTLDSEIVLTDNAHAGSCDRAGDTDKMYVRTAGHRHIEVINITTGRWIKSIDLNYKPRSSGGYNKYRRLQAISTKEMAWANVIDVDTDKVVITVGSDGGATDGNDGGNATGHTVWLDANHFALLDRMHNNIQVYRINECFPSYTTTLMQTVSTDTGCHSLRSAESGHLFSDRVFYAAIEGSVSGDVVPHMIKYTFDSLTGLLTPVGSPIYLGGVNTGGIHHFGIGNGFIMVPVFDTNGINNRVYQIDYDTWTLTGKEYPVGVKCGHADYSKAQDVWAIINHNDNFLSLIDMSDDSINNIVVSTAISGSGFIQSHANHISNDGRFYYFFEAVEGIFIEIDLSTKVLSRQVVTGGKPVQSYS